jgi:hypothetical protein
MKRLLVFSISLFSLVALSGVARADVPAKQEGRVWYDQNLTLAFTPAWSFTVMPGVRFEYARSREDSAGVQFLEFFIGPNYTYRWKNFTFKGSLWYYYMGYPTRGRHTLQAPDYTAIDCNAKTPGQPPPSTCLSTYSFSHNLEIIPAVEYRLGRWSFYDRIIFHNTFYADVYNTDRPDLGLSVSDQRWGWGTVLREMLQARYALTDRLGVLLADEVFFGIAEDTDTSKLYSQNKLTGAITEGTGYQPPGYWKTGFRQNRIYLGIDYKVTPTLTVAPMYMLEIDASPVNSSDVSDISHNLFIVATYVAKMFDDKK